MIFSDKHTIVSIRSKKAFIPANLMAVVLFTLIFLGGKSLSNVNLPDSDFNRDQSALASVSEALDSFDDLPQHSIPTHPRGGAHDENMIEPEPVQDDDTSEELLLVTEIRPGHGVEEGRILLSWGSLAIRPNISLIILHHSWKMYLS